MDPSSAEGQARLKELSNTIGLDLFFVDIDSDEVSSLNRGRGASKKWGEGSSIEGAGRIDERIWTSGLEFSVFFLHAEIGAVRAQDRTKRFHQHSTVRLGWFCSI